MKGTNLSGVDSGTAWRATDVRALIVLWAQKRSAAEISSVLGRSRNAVISKAKRLGLVDAKIIVLPISAREGQAGFRNSIISAYGRCCVTNTAQSEIIEAAHIIPFSVSRDHGISNGLALRVDLHCLFDVGLMTISEEYRVIFSEKVVDQAYLRLADVTIALPGDHAQWPSPEALRWHYQNVFNRSAISRQRWKTTAAGVP